MRADRPLVGAVLFLGAGLALILVYCHGTTGFNLSYPFAGSMLHMDFTTTGAAVLGGVVCTALGTLLLVWAFLAALVSLFTFTERTRERVVQRYSVTPAPDAPVYRDQTIVRDETIVEEDKPAHAHFWSRPARTRI
jgi:hypothetical protein